jgi:hypothetical protein
VSSAYRTVRHMCPARYSVSGFTTASQIQRLFGASLSQLLFNENDSESTGLDSFGPIETRCEFRCLTRENTAKSQLVKNARIEIRWSWVRALPAPLCRHPEVLTRTLGTGPGSVQSRLARRGRWSGGRSSWFGWCRHQCDTGACNVSLCPPTSPGVPDWDCCYGRRHNPRGLWRGQRSGVDVGGISARVSSVGSLNR